MKNIILAAVVLFSIQVFNSSCKKDKTATEQLPPITQTGANTFGCLINGNVWLPKGYDGRFINSRITIDPSYADGDLTIRTYKIDDDFYYGVSITSDSIKSLGVYGIATSSRTKFYYSKWKKDFSINYCEAIQPSNNGPNPNNITGFIKITRYDLVNRIFSGEFEITFNNTSCGLGDPVKITQGRFDYKL
jgi:hypothetical protein